MINNDDFQKAVELINKSSNILITAHTKPDGDACGCITAICDVLEALGKNVTPLLLSTVPDWYEFLFTEKAAVLGEDVQLDELIAGQFGTFDLILIVDTNSHSQLTKFNDYLKQNDKPILILDHHETSDGLGYRENRRIPFRRDGDRYRLVPVQQYRQQGLSCMRRAGRYRYKTNGNL